MPSDAPADPRAVMGTDTQAEVVKPKRGLKRNCILSPSRGRIRMPS